MVPDARDDYHRVQSSDGTVSPKRASISSFQNQARQQRQISHELRHQSYLQQELIDHQRQQYQKAFEQQQQQRQQGQQDPIHSGDLFTARQRELSKSQYPQPQVDQLHGYPNVCFFVFLR